MCVDISIFIHLDFPLGYFGTPLDTVSLWMVYSFSMEGREKEPVPLAIFFSILYPSCEWKNPESSFSALYLSLWLLEKTSVVQMWDGKSGLHWHQPCGCFGAGAHSAVGYRCLLSSINVASMWNHGIRNATQRSTPLIVWNNSQLKKFLLEGGWNTFLNIRSFSFRGVEPGKRELMILYWAWGTVSLGRLISGPWTENCGEVPLEAWDLWVPNSMLCM